MQQSFSTTHLISVLRNTLQRLEETGTFDHEDPASVHLKRRLVLAIAELEIQADKTPGAEMQAPIFLLRMRKPLPPNREPAFEVCSKEGS